MTNPTPLIELPKLAESLGIARLWAKDESRRALGNFKSLGGGHAARAAIARAASSCPILICASDGNHGLAVAAAARAGGAGARIYLPASVATHRIERIAALGARIVRVDGSYDEAVRRAREAAEAGDGILVPDTSPYLDDPVVADVMAGYASMPSEISEQLLGILPTHVFIQAGVGGLAAAVSDGLQRFSGEQLRTIVVEPASAACVGAALAAGAPVQIAGDLATCADMLACGLASAGAVRTLRALDCHAITVEEDVLAEAPERLVAFGGPPTTPSGAAGLAGLIVVSRCEDLRTSLRLDRASRVIVIVTEGPVGTTGC